MSLKKFFKTAVVGGVGKENRVSIQDGNHFYVGNSKSDMWSFAVVMNGFLDGLPIEAIRADLNGRQSVLGITDFGFLSRADPNSCFQKIDSFDNASDTAAFKGLLDILDSCVHENPYARPTIKHLFSSVRKLQPKNQNIVEQMLQRLDHYAQNLEHLVSERTHEVQAERKRSDDLLAQMLPDKVSTQLRCGNAVVPETFEHASIFFSDVVGFTQLSCDSTPIQVVSFLNDLYVCFDTVIHSYQVYKVETIGDAYMVVAGVPTTLGCTLHAHEIAKMSLHLLSESTEFKIKHRPGMKLQLRIGLHSGPVVAGVVGLKMPRYCLFGDTVNTASRMESNGDAMRIHMSHSTTRLLQDCGKFKIEARGGITVKGKGVMNTFWLNGLESFDGHLPNAEDIRRCSTLNLNTSGPSGPLAAYAGTNESNDRRKSSMNDSLLKVESL